MNTHPYTYVQICIFKHQMAIINFEVQSIIKNKKKKNFKGEESFETCL